MVRISISNKEAINPCKEKNSRKIHNDTNYLDLEIFLLHLNTFCMKEKFRERVFNTTATDVHVLSIFRFVTVKFLDFQISGRR